MITVVYWMKGEPKQAKQFKTMPEAQAFMLALHECESCEGYSIERERRNRDETSYERTKK